MKITAQDLKALGVIEEIIPEHGMAESAGTDFHIALHEEAV